MDRHGRLFSADECRMELEAYKEIKKYRKISEKPSGKKLFLYKSFVTVGEQKERMVQMIKHLSNVKKQ